MAGRRACSRRGAAAGRSTPRRARWRSASGTATSVPSGENASPPAPPAGQVDRPLRPSGGGVEDAEPGRSRPRPPAGRRATGPRKPKPISVRPLKSCQALAGLDVPEPDLAQRHLDPRRRPRPSPPRPARSTGAGAHRASPPRPVTWRNPTAGARAAGIVRRSWPSSIRQTRTSRHQPRSRRPAACRRA